MAGTDDVGRALEALAAELEEVRAKLDAALRDSQQRQERLLNEILGDSATRRTLLNALRDERDRLQPKIDRIINIRKQLLEEYRPRIKEIGEDEAALERLTEEFAAELRARLEKDRGR